MADKKNDKDQEKEKKDKAAAEAPAAAPAEKAPRKPPGMIKLFLFVAMPLMIFQAGIAYFLISRYMVGAGSHAPAANVPSAVANHGESTTDSTSPAAQEHGMAKGDGKHEEAGGSEALADTPEERSKRFTHYIKDIIVNPAATAGTRFLNVSFAFDYGREKLKNELEGEDFRLRDAIINLLVTKRIDEIDGADDKELLRQQILTVVNDVLKTGRVRKVYFINFVIQ